MIALKENGESRLVSAISGAVACFLIAVVFVVFRVGIPWILLPFAGGAGMLLGYNWGAADMSSRKIRENKNLDELALMFAAQNSSRSRLAYEFQALAQINRAGRRPGPKGRARLDGAASCYAGTGQRSGDSYGWEQLPDGRFAAAVSDGMGKGEEAARESSLAVNAIIRLLRAGLDPELAIKLLNVILMMDGGNEIYATMDLAIMDPATRELIIYKVGGAPTVIKRKGRTEVLTAPAMPMGIMEYDKIPHISTIIDIGDKIIMMTDGISDSSRHDRELKWMKKMMSRIKSDNPQTIADLLVREAALNYGQGEKDDMTVLVFSCD